MTKHRARSSNSARRRRNGKPLFYHDTEFDRYFAALPYRARSRADAPLYRVVTLVRVGDRADWAWIGCATRGDKRAPLACVGREIYGYVERVDCAPFPLPSHEIREYYEAVLARLRWGTSKERPSSINPLFFRDEKTDTYYAIVSCRSPVHAEGTFFRVLKLVSVGDRAAWGWLGFASSRNKRALHDLVGSVVYKSLRRVASASVRLPSREVKEGWERAEARLRRAQLRVA